MWGLVFSHLSNFHFSIISFIYLSIIFALLCYYHLLFSYRTYADKLSPKVVQSLLDLLCSQLKNLLSQAGVLLMASFGEGEGEEGEEEEKKVDSSGEIEKRDFRGIINLFLCLNKHLLSPYSVHIIRM